MDRVYDGFGQNIANAGPAITGLLIISAVFALIVLRVVLPLQNRRADMAEEKQKAELELAATREARKNRESERRDAQQEEANRLTGQFLKAYERATQVQEQTNTLLASFDARMQSLEATLDESKDRSRGMAGEVHEIHAHLVGGRSIGGTA